MSLNWKGRPYRPVGGTGYIRVYKPDINDLIKPLSQKKGLGSAILTGNIINPQNSPQPQNVTPTPTPSVTQTSTMTSTPTNTPSVTPTELYDIYLFEECNNVSNKFRFENVPGTLIEGNTYLISGGSSSCNWNDITEQWNNNSNDWNDCSSVFNGYATVISYSGVGTLYSSSGVTFTLQGACPTSTPTNTPTVTQTSTPSNTPTNTSTQTNTPSQTQTNTPTNTTTPTNTPTNTTTTTPTPSSTPAPFSPSGLTNLQFWFMSNSGSSVSSWTNYGLLGSNVSQGTASKQPQILTGRTLGSYTGTSVYFGDNDFMTNAGFSSTNFSASSIFSVTKGGDTVPPQPGWAIVLSGTSGIVWDYQQNGQITRKRPGSYTFSGSPGPLLLCTSGNTTGYTGSFNDFIPTSATTTYTASTVTRLDFGYDGTNGNVEIFEFIAYDRVLTTSEYDDVVDYLKTKYQYNTW